MIERYERVRKIEGDTSKINKGIDEKMIVFELQNQKKIAYIVDRITFSEIRKRLLRGICGVLRINDENKVDLNQVSQILVDGKPFEA